MQELSSIRRAASVIELLVSIACIALLIATSMPAVQAARSSARRTQCISNLRQTGIAVQSYSSVNDSLPESLRTGSNGLTVGEDGVWSIHARLLPYAEGTSVHERIGFQSSWKHAHNRAIAPLRIPTYLCPSDGKTFPRHKNGHPYVHPITYGFNLGTWFVFDPQTGRTGDGAFGVNRQTRLSSFTRGLSHTICASEVKAYTSYIRNSDDPGGLAFHSPTDIAAFVLSADTKFGPTQEQNSGHTVWCDGRVHHSGFTTTFTPNTYVGFTDENGVKYDLDFNSRQEGKSAKQRTYAAITSRSYHVGLVQTLFMDGSVTAIHDDIALDVWRHMSRRTF